MRTRHAVLEIKINKLPISFFLIFTLHRIFEWLKYFIRCLHDNIVEMYFLFYVINNSKDVIMYHIVILTRSETSK